MIKNAGIGLSIAGAIVLLWNVITRNGRAVSFSIPGEDGPTSVFYAGRISSMESSIGLIAGIVMILAGVSLIIIGQKKRK